MDPITQGALGAALAQAIVGERLGRRAWWLGALGGMAPDLDVLIRSAGDPLLAIEYHRHFTHSLAFIPIGGLLVALPFSFSEGSRNATALEISRQRVWIAIATMLGWATHGLLDAFTSYGTQLWWPFSHARVAWNWISVVDPIYTIALILGVVIAAGRTPRQPPEAEPTLRRRVRRPAIVGLLIATLYLALGGVQHARASAVQRELAQQREHAIVRGRVDPLLFNNLLWRSTYLDEQGLLHADTLVLPWWSDVRVHEGSFTRALQLDAGWPPQGETEPERDLALFAWFADGLLYVDSAGLPTAEVASAPTRICDARYSLDPGGFVGLFCVRLGPQGIDTVEQNRPASANAYFVDMFELLRTGQPIATSLGE